MERSSHPRVVVGIDGSLTGLAALRVAVAEARRRDVPLHAVRAENIVPSCLEGDEITEAFLDAFGFVPTDIEIHQDASVLSARHALRASASDPRDLIVVGTGDRGWWRALWSGSLSRALTRNARCPILAVPAPEMARTVRRRHITGREDVWNRFEQEVPQLRGVSYPGR